LIVLPFFCSSGEIARTRPTVSGPVMPPPMISSSLRSYIVRRSASCSVPTSSGSWTSERSHSMGTRMSETNSEGLGETDVAVPQVAQVRDVVTAGDGAVQAHAEREAGVLLRVHAAGHQDARVDDPAAAPLDPALATTRTARGDFGRVVVAHVAEQVDLGARLGEREVRRTEA